MFAVISAKLAQGHLAEEQRYMDRKEKPRLYLYDADQKYKKVYVIEGMS